MKKILAATILLLNTLVASALNVTIKSHSVIPQDIEIKILEVNVSTSIGVLVDSIALKIDSLPGFNIPSVLALTDEIIKEVAKSPYEIKQVSFDSKSLSSDKIYVVSLSTQGINRYSQKVSFVDSKAQDMTFLIPMFNHC